MTPHRIPPRSASLEQVLEVFTTCLSMQRDALVRGDLENLRAVQAQLQEAVQGAQLRSRIDQAAPEQREQLRQTLRDALSLCAVNASLTARAEAGVRRARSALGQAEVGLYGSSGESLRAAPHGGRRFGA